MILPPPTSTLFPYTTLFRSFLHGCQVEIDWIDSETLRPENAQARLVDADGILIPGGFGGRGIEGDRKSTRLNSSHLGISYAVFCLKKKKNNKTTRSLRRRHM